MPAKTAIISTFLLQFFVFGVAEASGSAFFEKRTHSFGTIKRGERVSAQFSFVNRGTSDLVITGVQAPCGCTTPNFDRTKRYAPGESGVIVVHFDSTDFSGNIVKPITVMTNELQTPDRTLTIEGIVEANFLVSPPLADFGKVKLNQERSLEIKIQPVASREVKQATYRIEKVRFNQSVLDVQTAEGPDMWQIVIKLKQGVPSGFLKETVVIKNTNPYLSEIKIPVRANIEGNISIAPSYIEFGSILKAAKSSRPLQFNYQKDVDIRMSRVDLNINGSKIEDAEKMIHIIQSDLKTPGGKRLLVELENKADGKGSVHGKLFFQSDDREQKEFSVDFYAFFR